MSLTAPTERPATPGTAAATSIPTARNVDHYASTVADLDAAVEFCTTVLGADLLYRLGPVEEQESDWMARQLGVHPRASAHIAMLRLGPDANLELFQYTAPEQRSRPPEFTDVGSHHLGIHVSDLDQALAAAAHSGQVRVLGEPSTDESGPTAGNRWVQLLTEWGLRIELRQLAAELPYEKETGARVHRPRGPWPGGLPGALGIGHVGYSVADLDEAVTFFTGPLGGELAYRTGASVDAATAECQYGVAGPFRKETAAIRLGPVTTVELSSFEAEGRRTERPRNSDVGGHHLAFFVDDVERAATWLARTQGAELLGVPQLIEDGGPIHGDRWVYFRGVGGFQLEVLNMPPGMPYERHTTARRFGPSPRWTNR
ncbi:VOC family protein [Streptomyces albidoflavus]|uniref:VOC family protein n=1 Tax=Streptomyces albidoflavus TaxID=1886 RepID=UPI0010203732|nr:VOC family protein [Streptomyces albidoflavus]RZD78014.1 glyoxalase/bleomycin resistance/dioxygenase family protein [Streptomyces albidoflavus]